MKKLLSSTLAAGIMVTMNLSPVLALDVNALPTNPHDMQNVDITNPSEGNMNVQVQGGDRSVGTVHWGTFNVGENAHVNFEFTNTRQTALNIVDQAGGMSEIYGKITDSGCNSCGYQGTGKVILINPNGVMFGEGANVNLNSFTVSTFNPNFTKDENGFDKLELTRDANSGNIYIKSGAEIHGDKNVAMAATNIYAYQGSKISTNVLPNADKNEAGEYTGSYGKVKLVTADGVNFTYYNNGAVRGISGEKASTDKMQIRLNGEITSGNIDVRNQSVDYESYISVNQNAVLKATKAERGNDGNINLVAANDIKMQDSKLETENGGNIYINANKKVSITTSDLKTTGSATIISNKYDVSFNSSKLTADKDVTITAANDASIQDKDGQGSSTVTGNNVTLKAGNSAQVIQGSTVTAASDINITGATAWIENAKLNANKNVNIEATKYDVNLDGNSKVTLADDSGNINIKAAQNVKTKGGTFDVSGHQTNILAQNGDINVKLANVGNRQHGLVAEAENNVTIETADTLSVGKLIARKGDMTLTANNIIAGLPYTTEPQIPGDEANRSYIYVLNGKFTSNTKEAPTYTASDSSIVENGKNYNTRHHIQYDNGNEKILLINKKEYTPSTTPDNPVDPVQPTSRNYTSDNDQTEMLNKIPRQPEIFNNNVSITNSRTNLVDVFAAASQIEIEDEEE